jgi:hypothetical protein
VRPGDGRFNVKTWTGSTVRSSRVISSSFSSVANRMRSRVRFSPTSDGHSNSSQPYTSTERRLSTHLTLFEMLGYRYALSAGGNFHGVDYSWGVLRKESRSASGDDLGQSVLAFSASLQTWCGQRSFWTTAASAMCAFNAWDADRAAKCSCLCVAPG